MDTILKQATSDDIKDCVNLIKISGPKLYPYIFASHNEKLTALFNFFYNTPQNLYSKDLIVIDTLDHTIRGLILFYPAKDMIKLSKSMSRSLGEITKIIGLKSVIKIITRLNVSKYMPPLENDEIFISNLAVFKAYRGIGISTKLMNYVAQFAIDSGYRKLSLYTELDNDVAIKVYEHYGFKIVSSNKLPNRYRKHHLVGFCKMVKEL